MADSIQFSLTGLDELLGKLDEVSYDMKRKGGRFALRKAAQVIRDAAKQNAKRLDDPETGRQIAANIVERWNGRLFKSTGNLGFRVGVQHGAVMPEGGNPDTGMNGPTPHWRLLELGTEKMRAQPFMRNALADNISAATDAFVREYDKALDRAIKRAKKKAAAGG
ncbi:HK97-gp10 family putative phage morphogenesis protein [Azotobacter vinelandii]|uniref:HK97-gp10 family putative phage morphogenesis protein n=1 Tax=Azotobacter vinelandii TaxID=354 RepID=UPI00091A6784|nr:HK97-gp10 family putative phage morphogenesis protein [Azotobacter vinelandii]SFY16270.1 phage protein, HK97 gp10 family [Azotobacter vinelandii]